MNVLIYWHVQLWPEHHAEALEIALTHIERGDSVFILSCDGELTSCPANAQHELSKCNICRKNTKYSLKNTLGNKVINVRLNLGPNGEQNELKEIHSFQSFNELRKYENNGVPFGAMVVSQIVDDLRDCFADLNIFNKKINNFIENGKRLYLEARKIIRNNAIDKVYVWNGRRISDGPVCYAANHEGIDYEVFMQGGKSGTYMTFSAPTCQDIHEHKKRINILINDCKVKGVSDFIKKEAEIFYRTQRYGGDNFPGYFHFAKAFSDNKIGVIENNGKNVLIIFTSSFWEFFAIEGFSGGVYENHYAGIKQIINDERITDNYKVIVRWHPNLKSCGASERRVIDEIISKATSLEVEHHLPESVVNSYHLIEGANIVIAFGSTIGAEASFYGKPTILLGRCYYEDTNACYTPKSHDALISLLSQELPPLPQIGSLIHGYYMRNFGNHEIKHLTISTEYTFTYMGVEISPLNLNRFIRKLLPSQVIPFLRFVKSAILLKGAMYLRCIYSHCMTFFIRKKQ